MTLDLVASNLLSPPILFFVLGMLAVAVRSDLDVPQPLPKLLSLYLLMAIGLKGGAALAAGGLGPDVLATLGLALLLAGTVPLLAYAWVRRRLDVANAAALAATYGSVSAVTFITAASFLGEVGVPWGGHMVAALALMETPAIIVGVALARRGRPAEADGAREVLHEAFTNGSVLLITGALVIGAVTGERGEEALKPFTQDIFRGMLCLFLLDMGLVAARRLGDLRRCGPFLVAFGTLLPLVNAALAIGLARACDLPAGDAFMLAVLAASASYIAVPAALRLAIPEATPGIYVTMALALTFPFNVVVGLPLYLGAVRLLWE